MRAHHHRNFKKQMSKQHNKAQKNLISSNLEKTNMNIKNLMFLWIASNQAKALCVWVGKTGLVQLILDGKTHLVLTAGGCPSYCGLARTCSNPTSLIAFWKMQGDNYTFSTHFESLKKSILWTFTFFNIVSYKPTLFTTPKVEYFLFLYLCIPNWYCISLFRSYGFY